MRETFTRAVLWYISPLSVVLQCALALLVTHWTKARGADPVSVAWAWEAERVKAAGNLVSPGAVRPDPAPAPRPPTPTVAPARRYYRDAAGVYWELPDHQAPGVAAPSPFPTAPGTTAPPAGWPSTTRPAPGRSPGVTYTAVPTGTFGGTTTSCVGYG